jgi:invasion protein IalB
VKWSSESAVFGGCVKGVALALSLGMVCLAGPIRAEQAQASNFWSPACSAAPDNSANMICGLTQDVRRQEGGELIFRFEVVRSTDTKFQLFRLLSPLGMLISKGFSIVIDGVPIIDLGVERCIQQGCVSVIPSGTDLDRLIAAMKSGSQLDVVFWLNEDTQKSVSIPLEDFEQNWDSLESKL